MKLADEIKVSLVTAACILALAIISKNVLNVQMDFITQYGPSWMFIIYIITREQKQKFRHDALYWSLAVVIVTVLILVLYSF